MATERSVVIFSQGTYGLPCTYSIAKQAAEPPALDMRFSNCYI